MLCENCEGSGWQLWMDKGKVRFIQCFVCLGEKMVIFLFGAQSSPPLNGYIVLTKRSNKWIKPVG